MNVGGWLSVVIVFIDFSIHAFLKPSAYESLLHNPFTILDDLEKPDPEQGTVRCGAGGTAPRVSWRSPLGPEKPDPEQGTVRCGAGGTAPRVSWRSPLGPGAHHLQSSNGGLF
ncbi:hypothetical protein CEXT_610091 [Caerostris extrusa]|uniref:Uncharacterized protein n=1 Tax=Caerostris extrusa TaxID=172846 RepID=A0AAV4XZC8_CAEEX|nr:hypothetical protein CEXT_610091 [Caerostris extrusa]